MAFYPLERIRVELQSQGGGGDSEEKQNRTTPHKADINHTVESGCESSSTPDSSNGSFDLVSSIRSADASLDPCLDASEKDINEAIVATRCQLSQAQEEPAESGLGTDDGSLANLLDSDKNQHNVPKPSSLEIESNAKSATQLDENTIKCFLRLYKEQTLYKGASHMVTTLMISNAIFFYALQIARQNLASLQQKGHLSILPKSKMGNSLLASSLAGAINVLLTNPLWVASLRVMEPKLPVEDKLQRRPNLWNVMHRIARNEGIACLWNGTKTSLLLVSNPIIQHFIYEQLRLRLSKHRTRSGVKGSDSRGEYGRGRLTPVEALICGAVAKAVATVFVSRFNDL